jgi:hypothetical protein
MRMATSRHSTGRTGSPILFSVSFGQGRVSVLRSLNSLFIAGLSSLLLVAWPSAAVSSLAVRDPLFGLVFDPEIVRFEQTDPTVLTLCRIAQPNAQYKSWVFAKAQEPDGVYLVLGGLSKVLEVRNAHWVQDWKGELVRLRGGTCDLIDPPLDALMYPEGASTPLTGQTVRDLAGSAVRQFIDAFGSRETFVGQLKKQGVFPNGPRLEVLRGAILDSR